MLTILKYSIVTAAGLTENVYCIKDTYERWVKLYELGIIISGLLTTSTFPGIFSPYLESDTNKIGVINRPDGLIRMFCIISFSWSLSCIFCCFMAIILPSLGSRAQFHEKVFTKTDGQKECWECCLSCICFFAALSFAIEFVAALIAAFLLALGFLKQAGGVVAVALGPVLVVIVALVCLFVFFIMSSKAKADLHTVIPVVGSPAADTGLALL